MKKIFCVITFTFLLCFCISAASINGRCGDATWTFSDGTLIIANGDIPDYSVENTAPWYGFEINNVILQNVKRIGNYSFFECENLTSVSLDNTVETIGEAAFAHCYSLREIVFPKSVSTIGPSAFYACVSLNSIDLGSVKQIDSYAFDGCFSLETICLPESLTALASNAFYGSYNLKNIEVEPNHEKYYSVDGVLFDYNHALVIYPLGKTESTYTIPVCTAIEEWAFACPGNIIVAGGYAYEYEDGCSLNEIILPRNLMSIKDTAFDGRDNLHTVKYLAEPSMLEISENGNEALLDCEWIPFTDKVTGTCDNLVWVYENQALTISGNGDIPDFDYLENEAPWKNYAYVTKKVIIKEGVTSIGEAAFLGFTNLSEVDIANSVTSIGILSFGNCHSLSGFRIPDSLETLSPQAFAVCLTLEEFTVEKNPYFSVHDGVLFNKEATVLVAYPAGKSDSLYSIPDGVREIAPFAFYGDRYTIYDGGLPIMYMNGTLSKLFLPDSLTTIGDSAFFGCTQLENINIPKSVTHIGENVFYQCGCLENILYEGSEEEFAQINTDDEWRWHYSDIRFSTTYEEFITEETLLNMNPQQPQDTFTSSSEVDRSTIILIICIAVSLLCIIALLILRRKAKMENSFIVVDDDGNVIECEVLFTFEDENDRKFIVYTDHTLEDGSTRVLASLYTMENNSIKLLPITYEADWQLVEDNLNEILEDLNNDWVEE